MCGRFTTPSQSEAERYFMVHLLRWRFERSYNVAPTLSVPVVRLAGTEREGVLMRWGLVPYFARGVPPKYSTINARVETLTTASAYRGPWERGQRCLLPATGFFEWHIKPDGTKQPYFIRTADQPVFGLAGLWDRSRGDDGSVVESCTIITMPANALLADIHNAPNRGGRMPAILPADAIETWLNGTRAEAQTLLQPYPADLMVAWPVGLRVNSARNDDPELIAAAG